MQKELKFSMFVIRKITPIIFQKISIDFPFSQKKTLE